MQLIEALNKNPRFGIAAPSGPCRIKPQNTVGPGAPYGVVEVSRPLSWFCAVIRLEVLQDVGLFDPNFIHYGDESDFHQRAKRQGWKSIWVRHVYVHHELGPVDIAWKAHDVKYYRSKWATRT